MQDQLFVLIVLGCCALLFGGLVCGLIALIATSRLSTRIAALERELARGRAPQAAAGSMPAVVPGAVHAQAHAATRGAAPGAAPAPAAPFVAPPAPTASVAPLTPPAPLAPPAVPAALDSRAPRATPAAPEPAALDAARTAPLPAAAVLSAPPRAGAHAAPAAREGLERWIGVRGAALLGGIFLALAGFLFFQYSIERGLITPRWRVGLGILTGLACLVAALPLRARGYRVVADALCGAGAVVLYAASYAAHALFGLWPFGVSFAVMAAVTVACCALAVRHSSQWIAVLGLTGGFATPFLLGSALEEPFGLFGYVLLLDAGFLFAAGKRRWPLIGAIGLLGTFAVEALWMLDRMERTNLFFGLGVLGAFAMLFVVFTATRAAGERERWAPAQAGAVLLPFALAIWFAQHTELGARLWPLAALCALLAAAACFVARRTEPVQLPLGAASGTLALVLMWVLGRELRSADAWELGACTLALALLFHAFSPRAAPALAADLGFLGVLLVAAVHTTGTESGTPWPWLAASFGIACLAYRQAALCGAAWVQPAASALCALTWRAWVVDDYGWSTELTPRAHAALALAPVLAFMGLAALRRDARGRTFAWHAAALCAVFKFFFIDDLLATAPVDLALGTFLVLGMCTAFAAVGARTVVWFAGALLLCACAMQQWSDAHGRARAADDVFVWLCAGVVAFSAFPLAVRALRTQAWFWRCAALAGVVWSPGLFQAYRRAWGFDLRGALPLILAALAAACAWGIARSAPSESGSPRALRGARPGPLAIGWMWNATLAVGWACLALPLQLERELFVAAALWGLGLALLARRTGHAPLAGLAATALVLATLAACLVRAFEPFATPHVLVVDWIAFAYLLPALAAFAAARALRVAGEAAGGEPALARDPLRAQAAQVCAVCGLVLVFAWINVEVSAVFADTPHFALEFQREPARNLAISLAWATYALVLLALGVRTRSKGLRWASLAVLVLTIGKVFLFDLGNLEDLYRVGSMLGLALSLLCVSLLYQRFVFRARVGTASS